MIVLKQSDDGIMTPFGVKPYEPRAGLVVNYYFLKEQPTEIINMPTNTMVWYINGVRYLINNTYGGDFYGPPWLISGIWVWHEDNTFHPIKELAIPAEHPAIKFFAEYLKDPV